MLERHVGKRTLVEKAFDAGLDFLGRMFDAYYSGWNKREPEPVKYRWTFEAGVLVDYKEYR